MQEASRGRRNTSYTHTSLTCKNLSKLVRAWPLTEGASSAMKSEEDMTTQRDGVTGWKGHMQVYILPVTAQRKPHTPYIKRRRRAGPGRAWITSASCDIYASRRQAAATRNKVNCSIGQRLCRSPGGRPLFSCEWEELDSGSAHAPSDGWTQKATTRVHQGHCAEEEPHEKKKNPL